MYFENPLIKEMDFIYTNSLSNKTQDQNKTENELTAAAIKYFPSGMEEDNAIKKLTDYGFIVVEYGRDGWRILPEKDYRKYYDEPHKKASLAMLDGDLRYSARKYFGSIPWFFAQKEAYIGIDIKNKKVISTRANVFLQGI